MKYFILIISLFPSRIFANPPTTGVTPSGAIDVSDWSLADLLAYIERFLLQAVLPIVVVGVSLYIAYQLFTAEGDEARMKKAFKSLAYGSAGLIAIACAYAFVSILSRLSI